MKIIHAMGAGLAVLLALFSFNAVAAIMGPVYPAPGGNTFSGNGVSGASGTARWMFSNFDTNQFDQLYYGLNQVSIYGAVGAGLDGSTSPFANVSVSGQNATWTTTTLWDNPYLPGTGTTTVDLRLRASAIGLGANPWITNLASIGLDNVGTFGDLGAVVDNSAGMDFLFTWAIEARVGLSWVALNSVQQPQGPPYDLTRSSFGTGFYYTDPSAVPVPPAVWLFGTALIGMIGFRKSQFRFAA